MVNWWKNISVRERIMVGVALICAIAYLFYQFLFLPLNAWHVEAQQRVKAAEVGYQQVILAARLHGGKQDDGSRNDNFDASTPLKSAIASSAANSNLIVSTTDGDDNRVQISLVAAEPEQLYAWMKSVESQYNAVVVEARINRERNNKQLVKADRLVFTRRVQE